MPIDLDYLDTLFGPYKKFPIAFVDVPVANELLDSIPAMIAELRAARKCIQLLTEQRYEFSARVDRALHEYNEATNADNK